MLNLMEKQTSSYIGAIILPFRLTTAWLFLSAVWRRLVLAPEKHVFESEQWMGHKINTFFPHSNGPFHWMLDYLLQNPVPLDIFVWLFTISELILGLLLVAGILSRFTGLFLAGMAFSLMHTAGWLGPTCLDEWQIASLLITGGIMMAITGSGRFSADYWLNQRYPHLKNKKWWQLAAIPNHNTASSKFSKTIIAIAVAVLLYVMGTNQLHHGGVWGKLHNYSKVPGMIVSEAEAVSENTLEFNLYRDKGPEAHGSFVIQIQVFDENNQLVASWDQNELKHFDKKDINNKYVNQIKAGKHSLVAPLGARADITLSVPDSTQLLPGTEYHVEVTEIGGKTFSSKK